SAFRQSTGHGRLLGVNRLRVAAILDVAAGVDLAVEAQNGGTDRIMRIRAVGELRGFLSRLDQLSIDSFAAIACHFASPRRTIETQFYRTMPAFLANRIGVKRVVNRGTQYLAVLVVFASGT